MENLRRYLTFGGFLLADANDGSDGSGFDASFRREMARVLPQNKLTAVPSTHVIYKSFFLLDAAPGRLLNKPQMEACMLGKRAAVMYSQNDLAGAWSRTEAGDFEFDVSPGGEPQRELAIRMGINLLHVCALPGLQGRRRPPAHHPRKAALTAGPFPAERD